MTEKKKVLLVGQNPEVFSGNGNMLAKCIDEMDKEKYQISAFLQGQTPVEMIADIFDLNATAATQSYLKTPVIPAYDVHSGDPWGKQKLINVLYHHKIDILLFVGIDIWRYAEIFDHIQNLQKRKGFIWKAVVPYDLDHIRNDWLYWLNYPDQVYVYSEFGYNMVKDHLDNVKFFRPVPEFVDVYQPGTEEEKESVRKAMFPDISKDTTVFYYVGNNQLRKNIYNTIKGFAEAYHERMQNGKEDLTLYLHIDNPDQVISLERLQTELEVPDGAIRHSAGESRKLWPFELAALMKGIDCHLLFSLQEGLSWTVIETKLAGIPSIISDSTAHKDWEKFMEENDKENPIIYAEQDEGHFLPLMTSFGVGYIRTKASSPYAIKESVLHYLRDKKDKNKVDEMRQEAVAISQQWLHSCHNFNNDVLEDEVKTRTKKDFGEVL